MKKVFLVALVFFGLQTQAQVGTDLQFSQAFTWCVYFQSETEPPPYYTVPAGKIWKIVSATSRIGGASNISQPYMEIQIGNSGWVGIGHFQSHLPLFISENKLVDFRISDYKNACISIIEYTVIP